MPGQQATVERVDAVPGGDQVVRLQQRVDGLPVMGGNVIVAVNSTGRVVSASAETPVQVPTSTRVVLSADGAAARAVSVAAQDLGMPADLLTATSTSAWLFDPRLLGAPGRPELRATWWVKVGAAGREGDLVSVLLDAADGTVALIMSERHYAKQRLICDLALAPGLNLDDYQTYDCGDGPGGPPVARREGGAASGVADVNAAYDNLGAVYDFYLSNFGRDSIDGYGMPMRATVRACHFSCPFRNAFWDGFQMVFGPGFAGADDVVGHEMTHGLTSHTSDLYYFAESGGINEALSDIMGELIDQSRGSDNDSQWLLGEDLPPAPGKPNGAIRSMKDPTMYGDPDRVGSPLWDAAYSDYQDGYGVHSMSGVVNKTAYLMAVGGTVAPFTVVGIGPEKSAQIWYRLEFMLPSGAEMIDLATLLPAACRSIIGLRDITAADCEQVDAAVRATRLNVPTGTMDLLPCPEPGMPTRTLFNEDFERGLSRWTLGSGWLGLPAPELPISWASSGKNALIVDVPPFTASPSPAVLVVPIQTSPADYGSLYVSWSENVTTTSGGGVVPVGDWGGAGNYYYGNDWQTLGYARRAAELTAGYSPGAALQLSIQPHGTQAGWSEWLVDDIAVYACLPSVNGAPGHVAGELDGTSATITWSAPQYTAPGNPPTSYEITVLPALAGSPNPIIVPAAQLSTTLTGLDPDLRYEVSVRALDGAGVGGPGVMTYVPSDGIFNCPIAIDVDGNRERQACPGQPPQAPLPR